MKLKTIKIATVFFLISNSINAQVGNTFYGTDVGTNTTNSHNSFFGYKAGSTNTSGSINTFIGSHSGVVNSSGKQNTFIGGFSGYSNSTGNYNIFVGAYAGQNSTSGDSNLYFGAYAGNKSTTGIRNVFIGTRAGINNTAGVKNTYVGYSAGESNVTGINNVMIGYKAGYYETGSSKLYLANGANNTNLLLYGDFSTQQLAIGTKNIPTNILTSQGDSYALFVPRGILTDEVKVKTGWADYVFEANYELPSLKEESAFIESNGHLMNFPSAEEIEAAGGVDLGKMVVLQQETIEKMMLHIIRLEERLGDVGR